MNLVNFESIEITFVLKSHDRLGHLWLFRIWIWRILDGMGSMQLVSMVTNFYFIFNYFQSFTLFRLFFFLISFFSVINISQCRPGLSWGS